MTKMGGTCAWCVLRNVVSGSVNRLAALSIRVFVLSVKMMLNIIRQDLTRTNND